MIAPRDFDKAKTNPDLSPNQAENAGVLHAIINMARENKGKISIVLLLTAAGAALLRDNNARKAELETKRNTEIEAIREGTDAELEARQKKHDAALLAFGRAINNAERDRIRQKNPVERELTKRIDRMLADPNVRKIEYFRSTLEIRLANLRKLLRAYQEAMLTDQADVPHIRSLLEQIETAKHAVGDKSYQLVRKGVTDKEADLLREWLMRLELYYGELPLPEIATKRTPPPRFGLDAPSHLPYSEGDPKDVYIRDNLLSMVQDGIRELKSRQELQTTQPAHLKTMEQVESIMQKLIADVNDKFYLDNIKERLQLIIDDPRSDLRLYNRACTIKSILEELFGKGEDRKNK